MRGIAIRMGYHGPVLDDATQEGFIGLMEAAKSYRPEAGTKFLSWAGMIVRHRISDWARAQDHLSRATRRDRTEEELDSPRWRQPARWDWERYEKGPEIEDRSWMFLAEPSHDREALKAFIRWWNLNRHPNKSSQVTLAMYLDGFTLLEISYVLNVTESRVAQIWKNIVLDAQAYGRHFRIQRAA